MDVPANLKKGILRSATKRRMWRSVVPQKTAVSRTFSGGRWSRETLARIKTFYACKGKVLTPTGGQGITPNVTQQYQNDFVNSSVSSSEQGFHVAIMCPRCEGGGVEPMHYLMALRTGGIWTASPGPRLGKNDALEMYRRMVGPDVDRLPTDRYAMLNQESEIMGRNQTVRTYCQRCKFERRVQFETLKREAHRAWKNRWPRLTFDPNDTLIELKT